MTRRRAPHSLDAALTRIAHGLPGGWDEMAEITRRRPTLVRSWADPERREEIPVRDAIQLDRAFRDAGGGATPIFAFYADRLGCDASLPAGTAQLLAHAAVVVRECGEAGAALLDAMRPGAASTALDQAASEVREAIGVLQSTLAMLAGHQAGSPGPVPDIHPSTGPP